MNYAEDRQRRAQQDSLRASAKAAGSIPKLTSDVLAAEAKVRDARYLLRGAIREAERTLSPEQIELLTEGAEDPRMV